MSEHTRLLAMPIRDLVEPVHLIGPETLVSEVKSIFGEDEPLMAVVVVENQRPLGLVMSHRLDRALSQQFGVAVYSKRPISKIMDPKPLVLDSSTLVENAARMSMSRAKSHIYDHVVVTEEGAVTGIVSVKQLLDVLAELRQKHTVVLMEVNERLEKEITTRKQVEEDLKNANSATELVNLRLFEALEKLKDIDRMKTEFLSTVSHELRTPLTSILGFATMVRIKLEDAIFPSIASPSQSVAKAVDKVRRNIGIIEREGDRLTKLINDLLDIAKMESGRMQWRQEDAPLEDLIIQAATATSSLFEQSDIPLHMDLAPDLPVLTADRDRLIQVVINLLSNAVKFTERGGVTLSAGVNNGEAYIAVEDTGMGIPEDKLLAVFEKFRQVGDTLTDRPKGTGLGLPICKQIVEHHGGRIWAESTLGQGSKFIFALPVNPGPADADASAASTTQASQKLA